MSFFDVCQNVLGGGLVKLFVGLQTETQTPFGSWVRVFLFLIAMFLSALVVH